MKEPSEKRKRTLALHDRAIRFSAGVADLQLESEAGQLAAIFATIILNMRQRLEEEQRPVKSQKL